MIRSYYLQSILEKEYIEKVRINTNQLKSTFHRNILINQYAEIRFQKLMHNVSENNFMGKISVEAE